MVTSTGMPALLKPINSPRAKAQGHPISHQHYEYISLRASLSQIILVSKYSTAQMAKSSLVLAGALLIVLLFAYGITFTEERLLWKEDEKLYESGNHVSSRKTDRDVLEDAESTSNVNTASGGDDFRPTTPGHSPGAGHSTGPASNDNN